MALKAVQVLTEKSKHVGVYSAYLRMLVESKKIACHKIVRSNNVADILTKVGTAKEFADMRKLIFKGIGITFVKDDD